MDTSDTKIKYPIKSNVAIAAAITAYARIKMIPYKLLPGTIYTDTDSIITDLELPEELVSPNELGKLKLEHIITEGYFISDKTYCFKNVKGEVIKRAKGVKAKFLTWEDYKKMYELKEINAVKVSSFRDYAKGSVVIKTKKDVKLNPSYYNKRVRLYNNNNQWVSTKPLIINTVCKDIILYQNKDLIIYSRPKLNFILLNNNSIIFKIY